MRVSYFRAQFKPITSVNVISSSHAEQQDKIVRLGLDIGIKNVCMMYEHYTLEIILIWRIFYDFF